MNRLCTPVWLVRHLVAAALVVAFCWLGWWQLGRATGGNALSWAYAIEWPVFAGFVGFIWFAEVRRELRGTGSRGGAAAAADLPSEAATGPSEYAASGPDTGSGTQAVGVRRPVRVPPRRVPPSTDAEDPELARYNAYLAWLNEHPGARPGDYPG